MNRYGKILNGKTEVKVTPMRGMDKVYEQVSADVCPDGFKPVERVLPYPRPEPGKEVAFIIRDEGDMLVKTGFLVDAGTRFYGRTFSKLKVVAALIEAKLWPTVKEWIVNSGLYDLYLAAQNFSEEDPYFIRGKSEMMSALGMDEKAVEAILSQCVAD